MTPEQYRERVYAQLDITRTVEKNRIILGFIEQLFPNGDPDHQVKGESFIAEAINLLAAFHPGTLKFSEEKTEAHDEPPDIQF